MYDISNISLLVRVLSTTLVYSGIHGDVGVGFCDQFSGEVKFEKGN